MLGRVDRLARAITPSHPLQYYFLLLSILVVHCRYIIITIRIEYNLLFRFQHIWQNTVPFGQHEHYEIIIIINKEVSKTNKVTIINIFRRGVY